MMRSSFLIGVVLSLSLQAKAITYCPCPPIGAIRKLEEERREQEQKEQNALMNKKKTEKYISDH